MTIVRFNFFVTVRTATITEKNGRADESDHSNRDDKPNPPLNISYEGMLLFLCFSVNYSKKKKTKQ